MVLAPAPAKISNIAGFIANIGVSAAIGNLNLPKPLQLQRCKAGLFFSSNICLIGIAQDIHMKVRSKPVIY